MRQVQIASEHDSSGRYVRIRKVSLRHFNGTYELSLPNKLSPFLLSHVISRDLLVKMRVIFVL